MNLSDYTYILNRPDAINDRQTAALEKIVDEFPFFQSARALRLKGLYNEDSFKYNYALKVTAAHTTDRSVLFDFITSDTFTAIQKGLYDQKLEALHDIDVQGGEIVTTVEDQPEPAKNTLEQWILKSIKAAAPAANTEDATIANLEEATPTSVAADTKTKTANIEEPPQDVATENLEIGRPLEFSKSEKHSFQEWLQLSALKVIVRDDEPAPVEKPTDELPVIRPSEVDADKQKKNELIDRFIETNPKIPPVRTESSIPAITAEPSNADNSYLMTETLARVYLEQKKYSKAIQAYQILILKYPEKSSFFADRILDIKHLQQNNNIK
ncbi:MAG TPA: tetratricopeptide repeat protein [Flavobacterium sp.]|nr:tetratricopeptide repeat protein [Flavobacterium sp.]